MPAADIFPGVDVADECKAVADYTVAAPAAEKIKNSDSLALELLKTRDILRKPLVKERKQHNCW